MIFAFLPTPGWYLPKVKDKADGIAREMVDTDSGYTKDKTLAEQELSDTLLPELEQKLSIGLKQA